jgi:hypothetical protein
MFRRRLILLALEVHRQVLAGYGPRADAVVCTAAHNGAPGLTLGALRIPRLGQKDREALRPEGLHRPQAPHLFLLLRADKHGTG